MLAERLCNIWQTWHLVHMQSDVLQGTIANHFVLLDTGSIGILIDEWI